MLLFSLRLVLRAKSHLRKLSSKLCERARAAHAVIQNSGVPDFFSYILTIAMPKTPVFLYRYDLAAEFLLAHHGMMCYKELRRHSHETNYPRRKPFFFCLPRMRHN